MRFTECLQHSGKTVLHSGKSSATLGEDPPAIPPTGKNYSPSAKNLALGEGFPECHARTWGTFDAAGYGRRRLLFSFLPRVHHSGKIIFLKFLLRVLGLLHSGSYL
jgi:hypothetical protein